MAFNAFRRTAAQGIPLDKTLLASVALLHPDHAT
jgi:hypothetical protein